MKFAVTVLVCGLLAVSSAIPRRLSPRQLISNRKIVGGEPAVQGEIPYQLSLRYRGSHFCGASIIEANGKQIVLTAAHCVDDGDATGLTVIAGDVNRLDNSGLEQTRTVTRVIVNEDYDSWEFSNDIALLVIDRPFDLNDNVKTIPLPTKGQQTTGEILVSGWGTLTSGSSSLPAVLQKVAIPVVSDRDCADAYSGVNPVLESMLCAGLLGEGGKDSCQGDSGGPLKSLEGGYQAGIVSWGMGCAARDYPGVNTEVSYFIDWINANAP